MTDVTLYAVFIHPGALEALGDAIRPYLSEGPHGKHIVCREIDSGGAFFEMTIAGTSAEGRPVELELMIPSNMVQMVVSTHSDGAFGFQHGRDPAEALPSAKRKPAATKTAGRVATAAPSAGTVSASDGKRPIEG